MRLLDVGCFFAVHCLFCVKCADHTCLDGVRVCVVCCVYVCVCVCVCMYVCVCVCVCLQLIVIIVILSGEWGKCSQPIDIWLVAHAASITIHAFVQTSRITTRHVRTVVSRSCCVHTHTDTLTLTHTHRYTHTHTHTHEVCFLTVCLCVCVCVCVYVYMLQHRVALDWALKVSNVLAFAWLLFGKLL